MRIAVPMLVPANWRGGLVWSFLFFFSFSFLFSSFLCAREKERKEGEKERDQLTLHKTTDTKAMPPIDPTTPVLLVQ